MTRTKSRSGRDKGVHAKDVQCLWPLALQRRPNGGNDNLLQKGSGTAKKRHQTALGTITDTRFSHRPTVVREIRETSVEERTRVLQRVDNWNAFIFIIHTRNSALARRRI